MALKKTKQLKDGSSGEYWRITKITLNKETKKAEMDLSLYIDKAARDAGKSPLDYKKHYSFVYSSQEMVGDIVAIGYDKIKARSETEMPDPFSRIRPAPMISVDADLRGCEDI